MSFARFLAQNLSQSKIAIVSHMSFFHLLQFVEALEVCDAALMEFPEDFRYLLFIKVYHTTPSDQLSFQESQT